MPSIIQMIVLLAHLCVKSISDLVGCSCFLQNRALALREAGVFRNDEGGMLAMNTISHQVLRSFWLSSSLCWPSQGTKVPSQDVCSGLTGPIELQLSCMGRVFTEHVQVSQLHPPVCVLLLHGSLICLAVVYSCQACLRAAAKPLLT
jgi:hypothetical protein